MSNNDQWITLKEASSITGKSVTALRLLINRKRIDKTKKIHDKGHGHWLVHRDSIVELINHKISYQNDTSNNKKTDDNMITQIMENFDKQRKEWLQERDNLSQGLIMYRYKYEELEQKIKLLPAPVEMVTLRIEEMERVLQKKEEALKQAEIIIQQAKAELQVTKKPWWEKIFQKK